MAGIAYSKSSGNAGGGLNFEAWPKSPAICKVIGDALAKLPAALVKLAEVRV